MPKAKKITDLTIKNLEVKAKRWEYPVTDQRGLLVVVFPSGRKSFIVRYYFGGVKRKLTLGGISLAAARKKAGDALYEISEGRDPAEAMKAAKAKAVSSRADTVEAICEEFLKREGGKLRTADERKATFKRLVYPEIGKEPIGALRRSRIVRLLDKIQDKSGDRMADITLAYLRKVFNWHAGRSDEFRTPLTKGMGRYNGKENAGTRILTDDEIKAVWGVTTPDGKVPKPFHALLRFLLLTGARRNEARELTWAEINGSDWLLPAARNKTKVDLLRPLSKAAQAVLASQPRVDDGPFVFTNDGHHPLSDSKPKKLFDAECSVKGWKIHDLRRTARTLMSRAGVNADIAERCLGHVIGGVRQVYDRHTFHAEMAHGFEALAAEVERIVNPPASVVTPLRRRKR